MPGFSSDDYFNRRSLRDMPRPAGWDGQPRVSRDKTAELMQASREKTEALDRISEFKEANRGSWASKLGLDPDSIRGTGVNEAASLVSGASRFAGYIGTIGTQMSAFADESMMTQEDYDAYNRYVQGQATPEDMQLLSTKKALVVERDHPDIKAAAQARAQASNMPTTLELFERAGGARNISRKIEETMDLSGIVHQAKRERLHSKLGQQFEESWANVTGGSERVLDGEKLEGAKQASTGLAELLLSAGEAIVTEPGAATEYIVENAPQILIGLIRQGGRIAMQAGNAGYAADNYRKGIENYQKAHNGAFPPEEVREHMALYAASTFVAESLGDVALLKGILPKKKKSDTPDPVRTGFKEVLKNTGKAAGKGTITEALTEGWQTHAEGEAQLDPASAKDIYIGGVIGGIAGGGLSGGVNLMSESAQLLAQKAQEAVAKAAEDQAKRDATRAAIKANDPTPFLDPASKSYDPAKAINVLHASSKLSTTTEETKEQNLEKASAIVVEMESTLSALQAIQAAQTPEGQAALVAELEQYKAKLAAVDPTNTKEVEKVTAQVAFLQEDLDNFKPDTAEKIAARAKEIAALEGRIEQVGKAKDAIAGFLAPKAGDITNMVEAVVSEDAAVATKGAEQIVRLAMNNPGKLSDAQLDSLVNNTTNSLTDSQRLYLKNVSAARVAANQASTLSSVAEDVLGTAKDPKHLGIKQYRQKVGEALTAGNTKAAERYLAGLTKFLAGHTNKLAAFTAFINQAKAEGSTLQVVPTTRGWELAETPYASTEELRAAGGVEIHRNSGKLIAEVKAEVAALTTAQAELQSAYDLKISSSTQSTQDSTVDSEQETGVLSELSLLSLQQAGEVGGGGYLTQGMIPEADWKLLDTLGLIDDLVSESGAPFRAANMNALLDERARRHEINKKNQKKVTTEEKARAIDRRAESYERAAKEKENASYPEEAVPLYAKAAELRKEAQALRDQQAFDTTNKQPTSTPSGPRVSAEQKAALVKGTKAEKIAAQRIDQIPNYNDQKLVSEHRRLLEAVKKYLGISDTAVGFSYTEKKSKVGAAVFAELVTIEHALSDRKIPYDSFADIEGFRRYNNQVQAKNRRKESGDSAIAMRARESREKLRLDVTRAEDNLKAAKEAAKDGPQHSWVTQDSLNSRVIMLEGKLDAANKALAEFEPDVNYSPTFDLIGSLQAWIDAGRPNVPKNKTTKAEPSPVVSTPPPKNNISAKNVEEQARLEEDKSSNQTSPVNIWHSSNENAQLSNLASRPFTHEGRKYLSVEHAYQSLKSGTFDQATYNKYKSAGRKISGNKGTKTADGWNISLMETLVQASFDQNPEAMKNLKATGNAVLTHTQDKGVWGQEFPRILMMVRDSTATSPPAPTTATPSGAAAPVAATERIHAPDSIPRSMVHGPRLKDIPELTRLVGKYINELMSMAQDTGWAQMGGRLLRNAVGNVTGRTTWIPTAEWFGAGMEARPDILMRAIETLQEGSNVYAKQRRTIEGMIFWLEAQHGERTVDEDSSIYDFDTLPDFEGAEAIAGIVDQLYDPEADASVTRGDVENNLYGEQSESEQGTTSEARRSQGHDEQTQSGGTRTNEGVSQEPDGSQGQTSQKTGLTVFAKFNKEWVGKKLGEYFTAVNPIAQFMIQQAKSARTGVMRPLIAVPGLMTAIKNKVIDLTDYLPLDPQTGEKVNLKEKIEQRLALANMYKTIQEWLPEIANNLEYKALKEEFLTVDMMQHFFEKDENGKVIGKPEENVQTAIAYAMYHYVVDKASGLAVKGMEDIATMHGFDKDTEVSPEGVSTLRIMESFENMAIEELGEIALQALGIKARPEAPQNLVPRLKTALGIHALVMLESLTDAQGNPLIRRHTIPQAKVKAFFDGSESVAVEEATDSGNQLDEVALAVNTEKSNKYIEFVRIEEGRQRVLPERVRTIKDANKNSASVVDNFFGVEKVPKFASTVPMEFTQTHSKDSNMEITKEQKQALDKVAKTPHTAIPGMYHLLQALGESNILKIAGHVDLDTTQVHITQRHSVEAQNENLERQLDLMMEMIETHGSDQAFHVMPVVFTNFRVGFIAQSLNQQASKIHRAMFSRPEWTTKIDMKNQGLLNEFLIAVAMNLDFKTDETVNETTLVEINKFLARPEIVRAAKDIGQGIKHEDATVFTPENIGNIVNVATANNGMMGLQALLAYSEYLLAQESGSKDFTVTMLVGADGKTSGPMLTHMALGAAGTLDALYATVNRGGFYQEGEGQPKHFAEYAQKAGSLDLYKSLASKVLGYAQSLIRSPEQIQDLFNKAKTRYEKAQVYKHFTKEQFKAIEVITKVLTKNKGTEVTGAGRNLVKTPLTAFGFGSALSGSVKSMKKKFIEGIYQAVADMANNKKDVPSPLQFINALNTLIQMGDYKAELIDINNTAESLLESSLSKAQELAIRKAFDRVLGDPTKVVMNSYFQTFIERRNHLNKAVQGAYAMYQVAYAEARAKEMERLMDTGEVASRLTKKGVREPIHDLTSAQEAALEAKMADIMPTMHNSMSLQEGNPKAGLLMAKTDKSASGNVLYESVVNFAKSLRGTTNKGVHRLKGQGFVRGRVSPGIAGLSYMIHSLDSGIMNQAVHRLKDVLSIHDEGAGGVHQVMEIARALNQATAEQLLNYSPATEANNMFQRLLLVTAGKIKRGEISEQGIIDLVESWEAVVNWGIPAETAIPVDRIGMQLLGESFNSAYEADLLRLEVFSTLGHVDQYPWEGGQFEVPQSMRDEAKRKLDKLKKKGSQPPANVAAAMDVVMQAWADILHKPAPSENVLTVTEGVTPTVITDTAQLGLPGVIAPIVAEQIPAVAQAVREGKTVVEAIDALPAAERSTAIQQLADASTQVDPDAYSPWGELGEPTVESVPELQAFFEEQPNQTAETVINKLLAHLREKDSRNAQFAAYRVLLNTIKRIVPKDMPVTYVTAKTPLDSVVGGKMDNARGWYQVNPANNEQGIFLLSTEHINAGLTEELLVHELLHAALQQVINNPNTAAKKYVTELNDLLSQAKELVEGNPELVADFTEAVSSLDEFVSWGITNAGFQQLVLNRLHLDKAKTRRFSEGLQKFFETVTNLIYAFIGRRATKGDTNGIAVLVGNVSGLLAQAQIVAETGKGVLKGQPASLSMAAVNQASNRDIYASLEGSDITPEFQVHLDQVVESLNETVHAPFAAIKAELQANQAMTPTDAYNKAVLTGHNPFDAQSTVSPLRTSDRVNFVMEQVEATLRMVLDQKGFFNTAAYKTLDALYNEMEATLEAKDFHAGDWSQATAAERAEAQAAYDYLFKLDRNGDKTEHLSRFAALGLAHPKVNAILQRPTNKKVTPEQLTFGERLSSWFQDLMTWFMEMVTHTYAGQSADAKLMLLLDQLVDMEAKRRERLIQDSQPGLFEPIENGLTRVSEKARDSIYNFAQRPFFTQSKSGIIAGTGTVVSILARDRVLKITEMAMQVRNEQLKDQLGLIAGTINDVLGPRQIVDHLNRLVKASEKYRHWHNSATAKNIRESFKDMGKYISLEMSSAVTSVMLRTGMTDLVGRYSLNELHTMLKDSTVLEREIATVERQLGQFGSNQHAYLRLSKDSAYHMVTDAGQSQFILRNAEAIARLASTAYFGRVSQHDVERATPIIDTLVSLYALRYSHSADKAAALQVFDVEMAREDGGNGIEVLLGLHKHYLNESRETLFKGNEALFTKGYTPEIYDPHAEVTTANKKEGEKLQKMGYVQEGVVSLDPADPNREVLGLYVLKHGGLHSRTTGMVSFTNTHRKGTSKRGDKTTTARLAQARNKATKDLFRANPGYDPAQQGNTYMVPTLNNQFEVVDNRYLMKRTTKNALLSRENRFDKVIGTLASRVYDKQHTPENNRKVIELLKEIYDQEYTDEAGAFLVVGPSSSDPQLREIYRMLPDKTKEAIEAIWGDEPLMVRSEMMDITFGYRNKAAADIFLKDADNNRLQQAMVSMVEMYLAADHTPEAREIARKRAEIWTRSKGEMWGEIVKATKDNIVNKTGTVLGWNIMSNFTVLYGHGVGVKDMIRHHLVAMRGALAYRKSTERLHQLQLQLQGGYTRGNEAAIRREVAKLENEIARNPVTMFMQEGMMPTIVEDIEPDSNPYSYASKLSKKVEKYTSMLNPKVLGVAKVMYMAHDTKLYQGMAYATQLSDFVARYTLYQHLTTMKKGQMTHEKALHRASESFINYDNPMHRDLQYLDSSGIMMFTKFFVRIQRVLILMLRENPARVAMMMLGDHFIGGYESVMETSALARFGNSPVHLGILEYHQTLDDILPVTAGLSLID